MNPESIQQTRTEFRPSAVLPPVDGSYIALLVGAQFGVFLAFITPVAISLSIKIDQLAPGHQEYLGYITGLGALVPMLIGPLLGSLSDRMRGRFGRRRPFILAGMCVGLLALLVTAMATNLGVLAAGWVLAQLGWGNALAGLLNSQADRVPEQQRGRVAGLAGSAALIAPVIGVVAAGLLRADTVALFVVPGVVGAVLVGGFVARVPEDSRDLPAVEPLTVRALAAKYVIDPRRYPDFSRNWIGRFGFYFGLTFNSTFLAFYFADRLGVGVGEVAGALGVVSAFGVVATAAGALGGGFLSDRLRRRRVFVLISGLIFASGAVVMALAPGLPALIVGSLITSVGLGLFSTVDQALALDVLPDRSREAGRYLGILGFATSVPQAVAPLVAPAILTAGMAAGQKNYSLLYLVAAACTTLGGLVIMRIRSAR
ncbi:MFS transporter [Nocardia cerradoensis]|uniref:MFS transporter n=1 Tax=Nocardia cerradoensis TaxID=85688 RepID=UPI001B353A65|nr:MFS transporter [Nocardia cerradoensis]